MRLSWLALVFAVISVYSANAQSSTEIATSPLPTTTEGADGPVDDVTTTTGPTEKPDTGAPVTDGTPGPTEEPVTDAPEPTDDGSTGNTGKPEKTTPKAVATTTVKTTVKAGSTTTKEPQPDVENFSVHCDKKTEICTYSMQVPGLDIDTYNSLMQATNQTEEDVNNYEANDLVNLQSGVTKVFDDAQATVDYVATQLAEIAEEINNLEISAAGLDSAISALNKAVSDANTNLNKILAKKGSCLYRQCVLKETTTTRPATTTTVRTTPTPFCKIEENKDICQNDGVCKPWYDSYYCTCVGNLDGQELDCSTSVCDIIKDSQPPGPIFSPGYLANGTNTADDDCDAAQWTVKALDKDNVLALEETSFTDNISKLLSPLASLQLTVGKYKLKINSKTKYAQINQILAYGAQAQFIYSGSADDYFHFTLKEIPDPTK